MGILEVLEYIHKVFVMWCTFCPRKDQGENRSSHIVLNTGHTDFCLLTYVRFIIGLPSDTEVDNFHLPTPRVPEIGIAVVKSLQRPERSINFYTPLRELQIISLSVGLCHRKNTASVFVQLNGLKLYFLIFC